MIRDVTLQDAEDIANIYNKYVINSNTTFDVEPYDLGKMESLILRISASYPYLVYEEENKVIGYCYVHSWKGKEAYKQTVETTIYLAPEHTGKGIGEQLMRRLISDCKEREYRALIACITEDNTTSERFHEKLGFKQVSRFHKVGFKQNQWLDVVDYELLLW